jgi:hypothetical protein
MNRDDIHYLRLNESMKLANGTEIIRVPGYWIYMLPNGSSEKIEINSEFSKSEEKRLTKEIVVSIMADNFNLDVKFYLNKTTNKQKTIAKKILIKILYDKLSLTHEEIAKFLNYSAHGSSVRALQTINREMQYDTELRKDYNYMLRSVQRYKVNGLTK